MSCRLRIKFKFFIDEFFIESKEIDLKIWNPSDSNWRGFYKDGEEQKRGN
jgi:hypothetical protein